MRREPTCPCKVCAQDMKRWCSALHHPRVHLRSRFQRSQLLAAAWLVYLVCVSHWIFSESGLRGFAESFASGQVDPMAGAGTWRLIYFNAPTRGEQVRLLFKLANQPFDDVRVDFPKGLNPYKRTAMGDASPMLFEQCPVVTAPDGSSVSQVAAIMQFVGRKLDLAPKTPEQDARALALALGAEEMRNAVFYGNLIKAIVHELAPLKWGGCLNILRPYLRWRMRRTKLESFDKWLSHFDAALRTSGGPYFCGNQMSYADVSIFDCIRECAAQPGFTPKDLDKYSNVKEFLRRMEALPQWQAYLEERGSAYSAIAKAFS